MRYLLRVHLHGVLHVPPARSSSLHHLTRWPIDKISDCCNLNAATQGQVGRTCPGPEKFREYTCCRLLHGVFTIVLLPQMLVEAGIQSCVLVSADM